MFSVTEYPNRCTVILVDAEDESETELSEGLCTILWRRLVL
jgi:hypothetical protein